MNKPIRLMLTVTGGVAVLFALAVAADLYLKSAHSHKPMAVKPLTPAQQLALQVALPEMTTNLNGSGLIQFTLTLQASDAATKSEVTDLTPAIEDLANSTMREFTRAQLLTQTGLVELKQKLENSIDGMLPKGKVAKVLFTTIVVQ